MRLKSKLAIITGAASGIGRAGVELFAREGAAVVAIDRNEGRVKDVVDNVGPDNVSGLVADLSDPDNVKAVLAQAAEQLGGVDILWNNAGIPGLAGIEDLELAEYRLAMAVNVDAGVIASSEIVPHMRKRGGGAILFTSSVSGIVGSMWSPIYSTSKFAVVGLTKSLAQRLAADGIRVNAICPGPIETPLLPGFFARGDSPDTFQRNQEAAIAAVPLSRFGRASEVAHAALWLASDDASYVTGVALPVDGGFTCR